MRYCLRSEMCSLLPPPPYSEHKIFSFICLRETRCAKFVLMKNLECRFV